MMLALPLIATSDAGAVGFQPNGTFTDPAMVVPGGIAIDTESGNVYVSHRYEPGFSEPGSVLRFDAQGTPLSPASMGAGYYGGVAVEQGGDHVTYAYDSQLNGAEGTPYIEAFDNTGASVGSPFPFDVEVGAGQIASDSQGNIYFPDGATRSVKKYTSASTVGTPAEFSCTGTDCDSTSLSGESFSIAVDPPGNVYVADTENNRVVKFNADGTYDSVFYEGAAVSIAIDPSSEVILVTGNDGGGQHLTALDYAGNEVGEIPPSAFENALSVLVAVNPTTETLYALKSSFFTPEVAIYNILGSPTVTTGSASAITAGSATLNGVANPQGSLSEDCRFEYTDDSDFQVNEWANAETVPCDPQPFNEETDVAVSAEVSGLQGSTTYDYRVVEETESGIAEGDPEQFTTLAPPTATTGAASGISQHAASLAGVVNPNGEATVDCHIEWGPAVGNYSTGQAPCSPDPGSASTDIAVSVSAGGLAASSTYHYRVVEKTAAGTANGLDKSFATTAESSSGGSGGGGTGGSSGGAGSTPPPPAGSTPPPAKKPLKCKKGFKKKKVHGKAKCVKAKKKKGKR